MPQYIVLVLPPGVQVPPEGEIAHARFLLTSQPDANTAATAALGVFKPTSGEKTWTAPTSALQANTAMISYGIS